jgi:hypothetical protein
MKNKTPEGAPPALPAIDKELHPEADDDKAGFDSANFPRPQ